MASLPCCRWLREEKRIRKEATEQQQVDGMDAKKKPAVAAWSNGWASGRMTSSLKDSSNAVMRM
jgi:hypothetical protein